MEVAAIPGVVEVEVEVAAGDAAKSLCSFPQSDREICSGYFMIYPASI